jgi:phage gp36-like protein
MIQFKVKVKRQDLYFLGAHAMQTMGKMNTVISDNIERRFRDTVAKYKGLWKGNISIAVEEAIEMWIREMSYVIIPKDQRVTTTQ